MTNCYELCSIYQDCQLKWYCGERGEEQVCCPLCCIFYDCNPHLEGFIFKDRLNEHRKHKKE